MGDRLRIMWSLSQSHSQHSCMTFWTYRKTNLMPARLRVGFFKDEAHGRRLSVACTFNNGSGIMRYELGIAGGLGYKYESTSKDFRRLVLFPSVVFGEQLLAFLGEMGANSWYGSRALWTPTPRVP